MPSNTTPVVPPSIAQQVNAGLATADEAAKAAAILRKQERAAQARASWLLHLSIHESRRSLEPRVAEAVAGLEYLKTQLGGNLKFRRAATPGAIDGVPVPRKDIPAKSQVALILTNIVPPKGSPLHSYWPTCSHHFALLITPEKTSLTSVYMTSGLNCVNPDVYLERGNKTDPALTRLAFEAKNGCFSSGFDKIVGFRYWQEPRIFEDEIGKNADAGPSEKDRVKAIQQELDGRTDFPNSPYLQMKNVLDEMRYISIPRRLDVLKTRGNVKKLAIEGLGSRVLGLIGGLPLLERHAVLAMPGTQAALRRDGVGRALDIMLADNDKLAQRHGITLPDPLLEQSRLWQPGPSLLWRKESRRAGEPSV